MTRFVGVKNNRVCMASDFPFTSDNLETFELPQNLSTVTFEQLVLNYKLKDGMLVNKKAKKKASEMKIALVGNYLEICGISTYNEKLWPEIIKKVGNVRLFIEKNEHPTGEIDRTNTIECWKRGENLQELVDAVKVYDPDLILIIHEWGLFPHARYWLSMLTQLSEYRTIVTMHSVYPNHKDKTICEAAMPEIITHLVGGQEALKKTKKLSNKVYVIPHGCDPCEDKNKLWNFYKSDHTLVQAGFGFRYKGFESSIKTVAKLKTKYPDIFLTILFSESPYNLVEHQLYYNDLMELTEKLDLKDNVAIIRGFQSDETVESYLRTNQVAIFPYVANQEHLVYGASGFARLAMSKGIVVLSSSIPHFSDVPSIKADTPEEAAIELDLLFSDNNKKIAQLNKQFKFIEENSWENIAKQYLELFEA